MKLSKYLKNSFGYLLIGVSLSGSYLIARNSKKPDIFITKQQSSLNLDNSFLQYLNLGQKRLYSSLFWTATILESDHDHYKGHDLNSWMYLRFLTISNLEPKFLLTYTFGGPYLSIIKDDLDGASVLYKKGLALFPNEYALMKNAAFHFYFEKKDYQAAYPIFKALSKYEKIPLFVVSSLARLEAKEGNKEEAMTLLNDYQKLHPLDTAVGNRIYQYRYSLKAEIDLECLNKVKSSLCSKKDLDGNDYIVKNNQFTAMRNWESLKIKQKKEAQ